MSDDVSPTTARGAPGCLYPAQPGGGPLEGRRCCYPSGKISTILIYCIVTCVCSINSVLGEDWEVCAYSPKCSYPVGIIPSQERQSFTMGCEAAGELILWWSNCNDQISWYCLVRWRVMFGRFFFLIWAPKTRISWFVSSGEFTTQLFSPIASLSICLHCARASSWPLYLFSSGIWELSL